MTTLPPHLQTRLDRELDEGESIRWVAQPLYRLLKKQAVIAWRLCLLATAFFGGLFMLIGIMEHFFPDPDPRNSDSPLGMMIFGGIVFLVGLCSLPLFLWGVKRTADNTIYALTNKRAIIIFIDIDGSITERDYRGDELVHLARKEYKDGSGTLTFESARGAGHSPQTASRHKFHAIERVIDVERMLRDQFGQC